MTTTMPTRTIYFDESGFTGYNLLDPAQPIFTVASAAIDESGRRRDSDRGLPRLPRARVQVQEHLEYEATGPACSGSSAHLAAFENLAFVYVIDKRFAVLTKIVDFLIEPYITDAGYDFYDDGFCWKYANYIHFGLTQFAPQALLDALLKNYQAFSRNPTPGTLATLHSSLKIMAASTGQPVKIFFEQMELGARLFDSYHNLAKFKGSDELQTTAMIAVVAHWRQRYSEDFAVVHDSSSNFLRSRDLWGKSRTIMYPSRCTVSATARLSSTRCALSP